MPSYLEPLAVTRPLQPQLDEITANTRALVPPERLARTDQMIAELEAEQLPARMLPAGVPAPGFALAAATAKLVRSSDLLALGPVIVTFFRGRWCPYDMTELEAWQALGPDLRQRRALLVAISPQTTRQNAFTADRHHLTFPLLSDAGCTLARRFGLAYTVSPLWQTHYRSMLVNIPFLNGDNSWDLPLPATIALTSSGHILHAKAFADPRQRPEPADFLDALDRYSPAVRASSGNAPKA